MKRQPFNITPNSKKTYICQDIQYTVKERKYLIHKSFNNSNCENENFEENKKNTSDSSNRSSFRSIIYQKENNSIIFEKNDDIFGKSKRSTKSHLFIIFYPGVNPDIFLKDII